MCGSRPCSRRVSLVTGPIETIRVALTMAGIALRKHHKKTNVRVSLTVGKRSAASTKGVKL